ncbi:hypothetical protein [Phenylobacterium sp.]|uniref:hypothetical protein n=1 Tax=Phenylobacterium sp. TaxID=1871053 RepID=UPI002B976707|nr:hypothetical protein [Phenylobacterium sp.]HVI33572.1 hypothetical protein [Phenylobacterium sp.]
MLGAQQMVHTTPALVVKGDGGKAPHDRYLLVSAAGQTEWVDDPQAATAFPSMREAMRMAMRLPAGLRAFGLPREPELALHRAH